MTGRQTELKVNLLVDGHLVISNC